MNKYLSLCCHFSDQFLRLLIGNQRIKLLLMPSTPSQLCAVLQSTDNKHSLKRKHGSAYCFKEILVEVDTQVAEKEKEDRKLEIYNRIEAKSFTVYRGIKFKKSDILSKNRRLRSV
jgi:hypothetical protein